MGGLFVLGPPSPQKAQLFAHLFFIKRAQVFKNLLWVVHDAVLCAVPVK